MDTSKSAALHTRAARVLPGGVNSAHRLTSPPMMFERASGAMIYDVDGNGFLDYHAAFGPVILGHCNLQVNAHIREVLDQLDLVGVGGTEIETRVAEKIVEHVPSAEMVHLANSGSAATYHAIRLARAVTGRDHVVKFQGCYHGWHDYVCMNIISPEENLGRYDLASAGMLQAAWEHTLVLPFNDLGAVRTTLEERGREVACVILECIPHNIGCVMPGDGFLEGVRALCDEHGVVLIFDEVITGFRHGLGGYQEVAGVTPDLTCLGKAIANGFPAAALAGKRALMERFKTGGGDVFYSGTFTGHPVACAAIEATIAALEDGAVHKHIFRLGAMAREGFQEILTQKGLPAHVAGFGSVFVVYFLEPPVVSYTDLLRNDTALDMAVRTGLIERGMYVMPTALKRNHVSAAHTESDIEQTIKAFGAALDAALTAAPTTA